MPLEPTQDDLPEPFEMKKTQPTVRHWHTQKYYCPSHPERGDHPFTHWSMSKEYTGKMCVPGNEYNEFYKKYAFAIKSGQKLYLTEKRSPLSRAFADLDFSGYSRSLLSNENIDCLVKILIKTFSQFWFDSTPALNKPNGLLGEKRFPIERVPVRCLVLHTTRKYPKSQFIDRCKGKTNFPEDELLDPEKFEQDPSLLSRHGAGIRVYFPDLFATDDQLRVMRRATIVAWKKIVGESESLGFDEWTKIFDSCVYLKNGLRITGSRKIETCKYCKVLSTMSSASGGNTTDKTESTECDVCYDLKTIDVNRVYKIWKVIDVTPSNNGCGYATIDSTSTMASTINDNTSAYDNTMNDDVSNGASKTNYDDLYGQINNDIAAAIAKPFAKKMNLDKIHFYCSKRLNVVERNDLVRKYEENVAQLILDTRIRTLGTTSEIEIMQMWNKDLYEYNIKYKLDDVFPEVGTDGASEVSIVRTKTGKTFVMPNNATAKALSSKLSKSGYTYIPSYDIRTKLMSYVIKKYIHPKYANVEIMYMSINNNGACISVYLEGEGSKFCMNYDRNHNSNRVYFQVYRKRGLVQRCFCKCETTAGRLKGFCKDYKSNPIQFPEKFRNLLFPEKKEDVHTHLARVTMDYSSNLLSSGASISLPEYARVVPLGDFVVIPPSSTAPALPVQPSATVPAALPSMVASKVGLKTISSRAGDTEIITADMFDLILGQNAKVDEAAPTATTSLEASLPSTPNVKSLNTIGREKYLNSKNAQHTEAMIDFMADLDKAFNKPTSSTKSSVECQQYSSDPNTIFNSKTKRFEPCKQYKKPKKKKLTMDLNSDDDDDDDDDDKTLANTNSSEGSIDSDTEYYSDEDQRLTGTSTIIKCTEAEMAKELENDRIELAIARAQSAFAQDQLLWDKKPTAIGKTGVAQISGKKRSRIVSFQDLKHNNDDNTDEDVDMNGEKQPPKKRKRNVVKKR